jgi:hypothetical protein
MLPPYIPTGWYPAKVDPLNSNGSWGVQFEDNQPGRTKIDGGYVIAGSATDSECSSLQQTWIGDPNFQCDVLEARGVQVAELRPTSEAPQASFWWVRCGTGFNMAVDAAQSKPGQLKVAEALIAGLVPAGVGPSASGC